MEKPEVLTLEKNYRSHDQIIEFNNSFFEFVSKHFGNQLHSDLYRTGCKQLTNEVPGGYVKIEFIEPLDKTDAEQTYSKRILETIVSLREKGFNDRDICILTRKRKEGIAIGQFLIKNQIPIVSSETLLLRQSALVNCLINTLILSVYSDNETVKLDLLYFL